MDKNAIIVNNLKEFTDVLDNQIDLLYEKTSDLNRRLYPK